MTAQVPNYIDEHKLVALSKFLRLTNYLGAAQLYLRDNFLLEQKLQKAHIKPRILGHWGTVPGLNFIYACLNILNQNYHQKNLLVVGPGHGYPALLANLFVEGILGEFYPDYEFNRKGFENLIKNFSWPGGFPSHANPETPGVILEGGELGYSLATSFGAAFDNPDLIVTCVVGDGESETGPTATAWHSNKYLNPKTSGAVLPIVHINGHKISGPTIYGTMNDEELTNLFKGYGYEPLIVEGDFLYEPMLAALDRAYNMIYEIQNAARRHNQLLKPKWPVILLRSLKGWTGPKLVKGKMIEGSFLSHGIPLEHVHDDEEEFAALESWLQSYNVQELLGDDFRPSAEILSLIPDQNLRMGNCANANGGNMREELQLPEIFDYEVAIQEPAKVLTSNMRVFSNYLRDVMRNNPTNFRLMSPDETESNRLHALFEVTKRAFMWPTPESAENIAPDGRVMEILSEHTLQGWLEGYILTGRHSVFISYEAFLPIVSSMVDQFSKFLRQMKAIHWRKPLPSMNFILTSTSWRQDHNGFSHQNPGFISELLNQQSDMVTIQFPADANMLIATMEECLRSTNRINLIIAGKTDLPQYLSMIDAKKQLASGIERWKFVGNKDKDPDVIFAATGDYATYESLAAIKMLREVAPELKTRFISVSELSCFGIGDNRNACRVSLNKFHELFTTDRKIIYSYHGYPEDIKQLIFNHPDDHRFSIHGYIERGTTTTPFDMQVQNRCSRFDLALEALAEASVINPEVRNKHREAKAYFDTLLLKHHLYIKEHGEDIPEVRNFSL